MIKILFFLIFLKPAFALDVDELLADRILGQADAPVTIHEYSSFTCPHCAAFHANTLPLLRENYIDTGKVRLIFHDFPLDRPAVFASLLSRCVPANDLRKYYGLIEVLFREQSDWSRGDESTYLKNLRIIGRRAGFSNQEVRECRNSQTFVDALLQKRYSFEQDLRITSTPTFIFNQDERRLLGAQPYEVFEEVIDSLLNEDSEGAALRAIEPAASSPIVSESSPSVEGPPILQILLVLGVSGVVLAAGLLWFRRFRQ